MVLLWRRSGRVGGRQDLKRRLPYPLKRRSACHDCSAILTNDDTALETMWESRWLPGFYGGVAQLGEHLPCKQGVMSSNLTISTKVMKRMSAGFANVPFAHHGYSSNTLLSGHNQARSHKCGRLFLSRHRALSSLLSWRW